MYRLYDEWFLISVSFTADIVRNVRILQNMLLILIVTSDLILEVYHNSSRAWEEFASLQPFSIIVIIIICDFIFISC